MTRRAILLVDHGSRRAEANAMLAEVAALVRAEAGPDVIVETAHMELAEPTIAQAFEVCVAHGATDIAVHPFMLSPGRHSTEDIPRMVAEAAADHPDVTWRVTAPLGPHPLLAKVILDRVRPP